MAYTSSALDSKAERNRVNEAMRASDVWRSAIRNMGLDPDGPLKLSKSQQQQLEQVLGVPTSDFHIDPAGNINDYHGWKGLPTAAKIGAIAAAALGTAGAAGAFGGGAGAASAAGAGGAATGAAGTGATVAAGSGLAGTLLKYGLQYGVPVAGALIGGKMQANAQRDSDRAMNDYYNRALDAEKEERDYRRGFDEEGRRYGRYTDQYGRLSDEEDRGYKRAGDTYGRLSDEEKLLYGRAENIRDKNYGYQQYGNFVETLEPFRASGSSAISRMSGLMGGPTPADTGSYLNLAQTARNSVRAVPNVPDRPTWNYTGTRPTWDYPPTGNAGGSPMSTGAPVSTSQPVGGGPVLVRVQAPDGEIRDMTQAMADSAVRLGARIV